MRSSKELLAAWDKATEKRPLVLTPQESELFTKAIRERTKTTKAKSPFDICNREKVMEGGVKSQLDGKVYTSRRAYETHLKDNGCHVKDYTLKQRPEQTA